MVRNREIRNRQHCVHHVHVAIHQLKKRKIFSFSLRDTWKNKVKCMSIFQIFPLPVFERKNINNLNVKASQGLSEVYLQCFVFLILTNFSFKKRFLVYRPGSNINIIEIKMYTIYLGFIPEYEHRVYIPVFEMNTTGKDLYF